MKKGSLLAAGAILFLSSLIGAENVNGVDKSKLENLRVT